MDEPDGTGTMVDSGSPTQTPGTWENIQAGVPGFVGTGYRFNGSTSRVTVNDDPSLDPGSSSFTVTTHVKFTEMPTSEIGGDYDLVRKGLGSTKGGYWKVEIYPNSTGTKALGLCQMKGSSSAIKIKNAPYSLNDGTWHAITCTKTDASVTLTIDGTNYTRAVTIGSIGNTASLTVGAKSIGENWYDGDMDDVSLQIGLTGTAISEIQNMHGAANAVSISLTLNSPPTTGDVLVVVVMVSEASIPAFDTPAGWTRPFTPARGSVFWKVSDGSEQTITVNLSEGQSAKVLRMWVVELRGVDTTNPFDQGGSAIFTTQVTNVTPATGGPTAQAAEWAIAMVGQNGTNGGGESATNGFTVLASGNSRDVAASKVLTVTGTVSTTISWVTARAGSWIIATFRAAPG